MNREVQVRICEGLGVKLPGPTRPTLPTWTVPQVGSCLRYTGRDANVVQTAARDPFRSAPGDGRNVGLRPQGCGRLHAASTEATEAQAAARGQVVSLFALVRFREKLPSSFRR